MVVTVEFERLSGAPAPRARSLVARSVPCFAFAVVNVRLAVNGHQPHAARLFAAQAHNRRLMGLIQSWLSDTRVEGWTGEVNLSDDD